METIGDAYMVVGGVPEVATDHAERIANQGIDMILKAAEVKSPATGKPIQVGSQFQPYLTTTGCKSNRCKCENISSFAIIFCK